MYNWILKIVFISASVAIVYFMRYGAPQKATYNAEQDAFPIQYLIGPCFLLGIAVNQDHWSPFEVVWAFSVYLEAVAILPQLFLLQKLGEVRPTRAAPARRARHRRSRHRRHRTAPRRLCRAQVENLTSHYVFALGAYRGLYLLNWIYRYMTEEDYVQRIVWIAGVVQTGLYCDFFYHYYESKKGGMIKAVKLPV